MKGIGRYLTSSLLAGVLIWAFWRFFLRDLQWEQVRGAWGQISLAGLGLSILIGTSQNVPRVWRWQELLRPVRPGLPFRPMLSAALIGYMITFVVPGRLGELVRPALLSSMEDVPLGPNLGSVVADRLMDALAIVLLFTVGVFFEPLEDAAAAGTATVRTVALALTAIAIVGILSLLVLSRYRERCQRWLAERAAWIALPGRTALSFARGMDSLRTTRGVLLVSLHSLICWLLICLGTWVGLHACGADLSFPGVFVLMPALALGVAIPTPGNVGGYQVVMAVALQRWFGVDEAVAVTTGVMMWLVVVLPYIVVGTLLMIAEGLSWKHLIELGRKVRDLGDDEARGAISP